MYDKLQNNKIATFLSVYFLFHNLLCFIEDDAFSEMYKTSTKYQNPGTFKRLSKKPLIIVFKPNNSTSRIQFKILTTLPLKFQDFYEKY